MNENYISRPRVEQRLRDAVAQTSLTLLRAPLGAGKTTAIVTAFSDVPGVAWMNAQPWHRGAFVRPLVEAVRAVRDDFGRMTLGAVEAGASAAHLGGTFARELAHVNEPLLLIVDDAQAIAEESDFADFVETAVAALPSSARMLLVGRSLPDLSAAGMFARGRAIMLESQLLAFDADDIRALGKRFGRALDDDTVQTIANNTEGWAAGVMLAVTAQDAPALASGSRSAAERYFAQELLSRLGAETTLFLERTSVFEILDLRILERGDAYAGAHERLNELLQGGAPLSEVGPERFRMHPMLREIGERRLRENGGASAANGDAARAYARAGEIAAALFHVDAACDATASAEFLRAHAQAAVATGDRARVHAVAARLGASGLDADVRWYVDALLEKARGSAEAREKFARASEAAAKSGDAAIAFHARAQVLESDLGRGLRIDAGELDELARLAQPLGAAERAAERILRGWSLAVAQDFRGARGAVDDVNPAGDALTRFNADILRAYAQTALGEADAAEETLDALVAFLEHDDRVVLQTLTLIWFARLALVWGNTTVAADVALQAERLASALDLRAEEAALYAALAEIATHTGDAAAAVRYADRARTRADRAWYAADVNRVRAFAEIVLARAAFLSGDYALALESAAGVAARPEVPSAQRAVALSEAAVYAALCDESAFGDTFEHARAAVAAAKPMDAADNVALAIAADVLAFLDAANGRDVSKGAARGLVTLAFAGTALRGRSGAKDGATAFDTALDVLARDGPRFEVRLARVYAQRFGDARERTNGVRGAAPDLTPREAEILTLLVEGLTNKELAQRLVLSPRTVETHVERILGKLEVASRSRAIAKALRIGLARL